MPIDADLLAARGGQEGGRLAHARTVAVYVGRSQPPRVQVGNFKFKYVYIHTIHEGGRAAAEDNFSNFT